MRCSSQTFASLQSLACAFASIMMMLVGAVPAIAHEPDAEEVALGSLVDAELAFARTSMQRGVREAFLANFADDGVAFEPQPVRLRETWSKRPPPAEPLATRLDWKPAQAGVAKSFDLGYTTGPYTLSNAREPAKVREGVYFSVWQRGKSGKWQVLLDAGIATPAAVDFAPMGAAPRPRFRGGSNPSAERRALLDREARVFGAGTAGVTPTAYAQLLAPDARLHRDGAVPVASRGEVAAEVARRMSRVSWTPIDARVSAASDVAVTWGRYREVDHAAQSHDGFYAHLWLRDAGGSWRLAYDVALSAVR